MAIEDKPINFDEFLLEPTNPFEDMKPTEEEEVKEEKEEVEEEETEEKEETTEEEEVEEEEEEEEGEEKTPDDDKEEAEEDVSVLPLIELMHENAGWDFDAEKFKDADSIEGLMDFVGDVIESNSKPEFASEEVAKFNEFVSKHGADKAAEYLEVNYGEVDYEALDIKNEDNQKRVYSDYLKRTTKFSDEKITKEVKKLVDLDELEGEVEEAKNFLVSDNKAIADDFIKKQEDAKKTQQDNFNNYLGTQKERINSAKEIAGYELDTKDKEGLYKFAFETDKTGKTAYQKLKDTDKDLDLKLLLLAYKGVDKAKIGKAAASETAKKLKQSLSRFKDNKDGKGTGGSTPKKIKPNKDTNYNDFILKG